MNRWNRRRLAAFWSLLLAATLACSLLPAGSAPPSGVPLTQAVATITAAAMQMATNNALASSVPSSTLPAAPTAAPTIESSATPLPTEAASTGTPEPSVTDTPPPALGAAVELDPCSLVKSAEVEALIGTPVGTPKTQNGGCLFADAATGVTSGLVVFALPPAQDQYFVQQYVSQLKASGVPVDAAATDKLNADVQAGDTVAAVNDLAGMAAGQPKYKATKLDGLGSVAIWSWNTSGKFQVGELVTAQPGALVSLELAVGLAGKETEAQPALTQIAARILAGLPASFTVADLQVAGSAPAIDPCSLASTADAETILGAKASAGIADQGECTFKDVTGQQRLVRVFAFPPGVAAGNALRQVEESVIVNNPAAKAQVEADIAAGDLVGAVHHMAAVGPSLFGKAESVDGLGDAGMFFALVEPGGSVRAAYLLGAKPGVLVGLTMILGPGDNAATRAAGVTLLTRILSGLPEKFTVNGAP